MIRRLMNWLLGRKEPDLDWHEKDRRLRALSMRVDVIRRGKQ